MNDMKFTRIDIYPPHLWSRFTASSSHFAAILQPFCSYSSYLKPDHGCCCEDFEANMQTRNEAIWQPPAAHLKPFADYLQTWQPDCSLCSQRCSDEAKMQPLNLVKPFCSQCSRLTARLKFYMQPVLQPWSQNAAKAILNLVKPFCSRCSRFADIIVF